MRYILSTHELGTWIDRGGHRCGLRIVRYVMFPALLLGRERNKEYIVTIAIQMSYVTNPRYGGS